MPREVCNPWMSLLLQVFVLVLFFSLSLTQNMASWGRMSRTRNEGRDLQLESLKLSPTGCERFAVCLDASGCRELILCPHRAALAL